ncbi:N,N-dimethylformamidase beta subunit family domain-containing protein [Thermoactinospora rubra]|uniref:N,N-dimethylformamidase beta subunit family domain-containing protein n=1 Tax=Thermoactinospora rubra TaxID=1088767 RepID=UPI0011805803|nr:N,N-dimethylformamidase beta subunit family domain-containing protein [Thermoactinospora rubra]
MTVQATEQATGQARVRAYAAATSCAQGETLRFVVSEPAPVVVCDATDDRVVFTGSAGEDWTLHVGADWPSSLYRARFGPAVPWPRGLPGQAPCPDNEVYFVVRQAVPAAPILLSVPFTTWQAYNRAGSPGQSVYWTESPGRAPAVTFDRPGGGPPPERWEEGLMRWLRPAGYDVAYCSNLDLHDGLDLLSRHRLLIVNGHDEYWSAGMRDTVEEFVRRGGNVAFFSGNTAWWQIRLEDGGRTMVCHRDAVADPVADPRLATVEWSAAGRPENTLTGVSFRLGAGAWGPFMPRMLEESYTARFAGHWVFDGTGLTDGDKFGQGCLGYETDAAEFEEVGGVPRVTCRDGTPSSFVVLATADLRHWSAYGQGGMATMGVFTSGLGTVFTAATVNWGNTLHDPVVERITRNVIDRLSSGSPGGWTTIGPPADLRALAVLGRTLYGVDADGRLLRRELCGQNVPWEPLAAVADVRGLAVPREAAAGWGVGLYGVTGAGGLLLLDGEGWREVGDAPPGAAGLAIADCAFYVATAAGELWRRGFGEQSWTPAGSCAGTVSLAAANGRLFALTADGRLLTALPGGTWEPHAREVPGRVLAAHAGLLLTGGPGEPLRWRPMRRPAAQAGSC